MLLNKISTGTYHLVSTLQGEKHIKKKYGPWFTSSHLHFFMFYKWNMKIILKLGWFRMWKCKIRMFLLEEVQSKLPAICISTNCQLTNYHKKFYCLRRFIYCYSAHPWFCMLILIITILKKSNIVSKTKTSISLSLFRLSIREAKISKS